jgi:predicted RecB family nuclease
MRAGTAATVLLGGYAAKQCPVRTQHDFGPHPQTWVPDPEDQARLDAGIAFEAEIFAALTQAHPGAVVIDTRLRRDDAIAATLSAMDASAPLILGGWLPDDCDGARTGKPDLLIRVAGGYLPGDVKHHRTLEAKKTKTAYVSRFQAPEVRLSESGWTSATTHRLHDGIQLAHYTRMLQACRRHPGTEHLCGAIIGTSTLSGAAGEERVLVWHDLTEPLGHTYSRSRGKVSRTLLQRYDHEHQFRVAVAAAAVAGDNLLVEPVRQPECRTCPYEQVCALQMGDDDASRALTVGSLDTREWLTLRRLGITTTAELADVDPGDDRFFDSYYAETSHRGRDHVRSRLRGAVQRAAMITAGATLTLIPGKAVAVPGADIEVDLDIEWDTKGRVYLWGARVRRGRDETTAQFHSFADWSVEDATQEQALAQRFVHWLRELHRQTIAAGGTVRVFHWSAAEPSRLRRILGDAVADLLDPDDGVFTDLERVFKEQFLTVHGTSIKVVAPLFGFHWQAVDAGGVQSQTHREEARDGHPRAASARQWLLSYNADDTAAMAAIRDGMRSWADADQ